MFESQFEQAVHKLTKQTSDIQTIKLHQEQDRIELLRAREDCEADLHNA